MKINYIYEAPDAIVTEMDIASVLCESQGQGGTFTEYEWPQE